MGAVAALADHPGYRPRGQKPRGELLVPLTLEEDEPRRPRVRRQAQLVGRGTAIDPWPFIEAVPGHPGYGLTPQRVVRIFRESEAGHLAELQDLYDDLIETDGHLRALFESRISAVAGKGRTIQPGGADAASVAAAEALDQALEEEELDLVDHLEHQLEAPFRGYSASEIIWGLRGDVWAPIAIDDVAHRRFRFRVGTNELRLATDQDITLGEELWKDKWVYAQARHSNLARAGLFRTATWWALFKRLAVRDWIVFAERFGIPHVLGYYEENASPESKDALEMALKDLGEGGQAILSDLTKIVISETAQRAGETKSIHPAIADRCDAEISKLINGATLTVQSGGPGSYALGKVHENRAYALELADANRLQRIWRRFLALPFVKLNGFPGARPPLLNIQVAPSLDPKTRVEILSMLVNECGLEIDGWHVAEQLGFRRPMRPEDATTPTKSGGGSAPAPDRDPEDEEEGGDDE